LQVSNLAVDAASNVTLTNAGNDVTNVAIYSSAGSIQYTDANNFSLNTVDQVLAVRAPSGNVTLTSSGGAISDGNPAVLDIKGNVIDLNSSGDVGSASDPVEFFSPTATAPDIAGVGGTAYLFNCGPGECLPPPPPGPTTDEIISDISKALQNNLGPGQFDETGFQPLQPPPPPEGEEQPPPPPEGEEQPAPGEEGEAEGGEGEEGEEGEGKEKPKEKAPGPEGKPVEGNENILDQTGASQPAEVKAENLSSCAV
jgi:hypothetical protein